MSAHLTREEFRRLYEREREALFRFLYRLCRNATDAEDLLQETFLSAWRKRAQFDGRGALEGWLKRVAVRTYLNSRARNRRRAALPPLPGTGCESPSDHEPERRDSVAFLVARVHEALDALPDAAREVFVMFRCDGMTCAQIAEFTETPVKTVETRLSRATKRLAERLRGYRSDWPTW